ncbi:hypothetical protein [Streptomyces lavendofoliae]|uniref:hypothetical protein n=1 Tax=Streptomyces lavendofoliae TaxID=67314 RepID=UPI0016793449|nr:hypothetical protein [Streptomyces lavendofoliae]
MLTIRCVLRRRDLNIRRLVPLSRDSDHGEHSGSAALLPLLPVRLDGIAAAAVVNIHDVCAMCGEKITGRLWASREQATAFTRKRRAATRQGTAGGGLSLGEENRRSLATQDRIPCHRQESPDEL